MNQDQKQALVNYFRVLGGNEFSLDAALAFASALSPGGKLGTEDFWREILRDDEPDEPPPRPRKAARIKG